MFEQYLESIYDANRNFERFEFDSNINITRPELQDGDVRIYSSSFHTKLLTSELLRIE